MKSKKEIDVKVDKKVIYYIRIDQARVDKETGAISYFKVPKTTVVLLRDKEGNYSRGVSMCCSLDIFNKKQGRSVAMSRALAGLNTKKKLDPIRREDVFIEPEMKYKIEYQPLLTDYEKDLLSDPIEV